MSQLHYSLEAIPVAEMVLILDRVSAALVLGHECLEYSPIRDGFVERLNFIEATSSSLIDRKQMKIEDLVRLDCGVRPSAVHEGLTQACLVLQTRRSMQNSPNGLPPEKWSFLKYGL